MNEIELKEAIAYWEEFKSEIPETFGKHYPEDGKEQEHFTDVALSALREKQGRDKGCEFCQKFDFSEASAKVEDGRFTHIHLVCGNTRFPKEEQFNFCPVCGRRLPKEVQA